METELAPRDGSVKTVDVFFANIVHSKEKPCPPWSDGTAYWDKENMFSCSDDHEQDWQQPRPVDPYSSQSAD